MVIEEKMIEEKMIKMMVEKYGPVMDIETLATVMRRSPESLRMFVRGDNKLALDLKAAKKKIGRRIYFRTIQIAVIFSSDDSLSRVV
ncbi:MAG: DNA-binding protein [Bdellovibrionaceae bacterium]|nr:DNA-binding protein [Pseudobdellovibrionaceae bacterium]